MKRPADPLEEAAFWYVCLQAEDAGEQDRQRWRQWLEASPSNRHAWGRVQELCGVFDRVPGNFVSRILEKKTSRRAVLRGISVSMLAGLAGVQASREESWQQWAADLRTGIGERRHEILADGSSLYLNSGSAVDVLFDAAERRILLHAGEVLIETHADIMAGAKRPFVVHTPHGKVEALGTRFVVRLLDGYSFVQVLEDTVAISPAQSAARAFLLGQGQELRFDKQGVGVPRALQGGAGTWRNGRLSVVDMRLQEFLDELARHRRGYLGCAPEIADLRVSGVFPLDDVDAALGMLTDAFPIEARRLTGYWIRLLPRVVAARSLS